MRPGQPERRSSGYVRHGTSSLFAALDVRVGKVVGRCYRRHRAEEFRAFLTAVDAVVPAEPRGARGPRQRSIHKAPPIRAWLAKRPALHLHFTRRKLLAEPGRAFLRPAHRASAQARESGSVEELEAAVLAYIERHNAEPKPFRWTKSAEEILASVARFCSRTLAVQGQI